VKKLLTALTVGGLAAAGYVAYKLGQRDPAVREHADQVKAAWKQTSAAVRTAYRDGRRKAADVAEAAKDSL
jgi:hypothetical protein